MKDTRSVMDILRLISDEAKEEGTCTTMFGDRSAEHTLENAGLIEKHVVRGRGWAFHGWRPTRTGKEVLEKENEVAA